eukprot:637464-Pyramimonas_sp.AAC.1
MLKAVNHWVGQPANYKSFDGAVAARPCDQACDGNQSTNPCIHAIPLESYKPSLGGSKSRGYRNKRVQRKRRNGKRGHN